MPSISEALCREMRDSFQQLFRKLRPRRRLRDIELAEEKAGTGGARGKEVGARG